MSKTSWGNKRQCPGCAARFYDLGKNPAHCPKCGFLHDMNAPVKVRRGRKTPAMAEDDPLVIERVKGEIKQKAAKSKGPIKEIEGVDLDQFEDIEPIAGDDEVEEIEEIDDDIETIEEIEDIEESEDELVIEDDAEALIDDVDEDEEDEDEEEEEDDAPAKKSSKTAKSKAKPIKAPAKPAPKAPVKAKKPLKPVKAGKPVAKAAKSKRK